MRPATIFAVQQIDRVLVVDGKAQCRIRRAAVDVDECLHCEHIRAANEDASPPFVICDGSGRSDPEDGGQPLLTWWLQHTRHRGEEGVSTWRSTRARTLRQAPRPAR